MPKGDPANSATVWYRHRAAVFTMRVGVDSRDSVGVDRRAIHASATTDELALLPHLRRCYSWSRSVKRSAASGVVCKCVRSGKMLLR